MLASMFSPPVTDTEKAEVSLPANRISLVQGRLLAFGRRPHPCSPRRERAIAIHRRCPLLFSLCTFLLFEFSLKLPPYLELPCVLAHSITCTFGRSPHAQAGAELDTDLLPLGEGLVSIEDYRLVVAGQHNSTRHMAAFLSSNVEEVGQVARDHLIALPDGNGRQLRHMHRICTGMDVLVLPVSIRPYGTLHNEALRIER
mmetsp:Transcript_18137/g.51611  ORF Transcript_18137/g.51611 Transcript_18137/m.51611 type:complete len:200 (-) Transcript_18137:191-790(-)